MMSNSELELALRVRNGCQRARWKGEKAPPGRFRRFPSSSASYVSC